MRRGDGVKITGKMKVHFLHWHHLRIAATRSAPLHAKTGTQRRLANTYSRFFADTVETITQSHRSGCLTFARRGRVDCGYQNQFTIRVFMHRVDEFLAYFGLVMAIGQKKLAAYAQLCANLLDGPFHGLARNLDITLIAHYFFPRPKDSTTLLP